MTLASGPRIGLHRLFRERPILSLALLGLLVESLCLLAALRFPLLRYYDVPLLDLGKLTDHSYPAGLAYLVLITIAFAAYASALRIVARHPPRRTLPLILLLACLFAVTLSLVYPWGAADIYDYVVSGKVLSEQGANPFAARGVDVLGGEWVAYAPWADTTLAYGPLWALIAALAARLAGASLLWNVLAFKGVAFLFYALAIAGIAYVHARLAPEKVALGVLLFSWNPLVLVETLVNGHNDVIMVALALWAVQWAMRGSRVRSMAALAGSALIKFVSASFLPFFLAAGWSTASSRARRVGRQQASLLARLLTGLLAFALPAALAWLPFWGAGRSQGLGPRLQLFTTSWPTVVKLVLGAWLEPPRAMAVAQGLAFGSLAAFILLRAVRMVERRASLVEACYDATFFYLAFACAWFQPWYLVWLVGLAALCLDRERMARAWLFAYLGLWNYFVFGYLWFWTGLRAASPDAVRVLAMAIIVLPPGLLYLWRSGTELWVARRSGRSQAAPK